MTKQAPLAAAARCGNCRLDKPVSAFGIDRSRSTGRAIYCADCRQSLRRAALLRKRPSAALKPRRADAAGFHSCSTCRQSLPVEQFAADRSRRRGITNDCRHCIKVRRARLKALRPVTVKAPADAHAAVRGRTIRVVRNRKARSRWMNAAAMKRRALGTGAGPAAIL